MPRWRGLSLLDCLLRVGILSSDRQLPGITLTKSAVNLWLIAAVPLIAAESYAQPCPQQIRGGWESELAATALFNFSLSILASDDDEYIARPGTASGDEDLVVWGDGQNLRLQSARLP